MKDLRSQENVGNSINVERNNICIDTNSLLVGTDKSDIKGYTDSNKQSTPTEQEINTLKLIQKMSGLGIKTKFKEVIIGPVVTNYKFTLDDSVPLSKILSKSDDLALSMGVESCLIQRIGGHIVISVPNKDRKNVDFKDNLYWYLHNEELDAYSIAIPLGMDIVGAKSCFDLTEMPHCLIAGSTGSGKSVFLASIIEHLTYKYPVDYLNMYLVDTKRVDLPLFETLPHVLAIADDIQSFHNTVCYQVMGEIRGRLQKFQKLGVRNIKEYHERNLKDMPYIMVIIDELSDVLELDKGLDRKKDGEYEGVPTVKDWLKQVTAIARAAGIHIIACTQRSSVKVVDGDIKANLPCRIALRLPTGVDSRTILGQNGAENLLGKGDLLIQRPEKDIVERYHGPYVDMKDIKELVSNYKQMKEILCQ